MNTFLILTLIATLSQTSFAEERLAVPAQSGSADARATENAKYGTILSATCKVWVVRKGRKIEVKEFPADIFERDDVQCVGEGKIQAKMIDQTDLTLYGDSHVVMENFLLRGDNVQTFAIDLLSGAFRFSSQFANSDHDRYKFYTHTAIIGIRGTIFTASASDEKTVVSVEKGEVRVTAKSKNVEKFVRTGQKVEVNKNGFVK